MTGSCDPAISYRHLTDISLERCIVVLRATNFAFGEGVIRHELDMLRLIHFDLVVQVF